MKKYTVLYNPLSKKGHGAADAKRIEAFIPDAEISYEDATAIQDPVAYINALPEDRIPVFTGGDGTVNRVVNALIKSGVSREVFYFPAGSGNDFINDLDESKDCEPFSINEYIEHLPIVTVNGQDYAFVNGVGHGLDGYCCEESDRLKAKGIDRSYTLIAFLGIMGKFKPVTAEITVDGVTKTYKHIFMAPTMFGRFYGGGVKIAPSQDRKNAAHSVTSVAVYSKTRIAALFAFLSVCKGKGESMPKHLEYRVGHDVKVVFDAPVALQIDGETIPNVLSYEVHAKKLDK